MAFLGADVQALLACARRMDQHGSRLREIADELAARVGAATWIGADAESFRERVDAKARTGLDDAAVRLSGGAHDLARHAAEQDLASSADGTIDAAAYTDLLGGESISDIINWFQDVWADSPFDDPLTIDDLDGRYIDSAEGAGFDPADVDLSPEAIGSQVMRQGAIGDCWLLSALMATARTDPAFLSRNIVLREDGTWDVTLYEDGEPVVVSVSPDQLVRDGARVQDHGSDETSQQDSIGYMSIYEQAAINHLGPDYESVIADTPGRGLELVTGADSEDVSFLDLNGQPSLARLDEALRDGRPVTVMTDPIMPFDGDLSAAHVYQVDAVDTEAGEVVLINPWGRDGGKPYEVRVPMDMFYDNNIVMTGVGGLPEDFGPPA